MYAHIFKARQKGQRELIISRTDDLRTIYTSTIYASKSEAKTAAKSFGAKPHNY